MDNRIIDVIKTCGFSWFFLYATWLFMGKIFSSTIPSLIIIVIFLLGIMLLRLPNPSVEAVEAVIGLDPQREDNAEGYTMRAIGHRGAALDAPENTLAAFKYCANKGCTAVEFDLALTKDNVPILFHDDNLERLTDITTPIKSMTWEELSTIDVSVKHPLKERFENCRVAKLDEAVEQCLSDGLRMFFDVKDKDKQMITHILSLFEKNEELYSRVVLASFNPSVVYAARKANPRIIGALIHRPYCFTYQSYSALTGAGPRRYDNIFVHYASLLLDQVWELVFSSIAYYVLGISAVLLHKDEISSRDVQKWRSRGIRVIAWTVNHPAEKNYFSKNLKLTYITDTLLGENSAHNGMKP